MINYMALEYHRLVKKRLWGFVGENSLEMNKLEFHFCYLRILDVFHKFMKFINLCHFLLAQMVKHLPIMRETWVQSLGWEDLLEKEMATHSSILAWKIPWMEELGRLQSTGSQRVRTWLSDFTFTFSKAWKWKVKEKLLSCVRLLATPWTVVYQVPPGSSSVHGIFQARTLEWVAVSFSRRSSQPRDWTQVSYIVDRRFTIWATREVFKMLRLCAGHPKNLIFSN